MSNSETPSVIGRRLMHPEPDPLADPEVEAKLRHLSEAAKLGKVEYEEEFDKLFPPKPTKKT